MPPPPPPPPPAAAITSGPGPTRTDKEAHTPSHSAVPARAWLSSERATEGPPVALPPRDRPYGQYNRVHVSHTRASTQHYRHRIRSRGPCTLALKSPSRGRTPPTVPRGDKKAGPCAPRSGLQPLAPPARTSAVGCRVRMPSRWALRAVRRHAESLGSVCAAAWGWGEVVEPHLRQDLG